jgi:hypothetical protein
MAITEADIKTFLAMEVADAPSSTLFTGWIASIPIEFYARTNTTFSETDYTHYCLYMALAKEHVLDWHDDQAGYDDSQSTPVGSISRSTKGERNANRKLVKELVASVKLVALAAAMLRARPSG